MKKGISILLALVIASSFCACNSENIGNTDAANMTTELTELLTPEATANLLVGTWAGVTDVGGLWIFDNNGNLCEIFQGTFPGANPENYRIEEHTYHYSVDGNVLLIDYGSVNIELNFEFLDENKLKLTYNGEVVEFSRVKDSDSMNKTIIGTWIPFGYETFELHVGSVGYGSVEKLSFYNDGTFRTITQAGSNFGEYKFLFDGEVLQMQGNGGCGEFEYELFGDEFMLLEFSIYNGEMQFSYLLKKES